ncbi:MAG: serine/threonine-protein kinase, partial [Planctomycetota bacterium]
EEIDEATAIRAKMREMGVRPRPLTDVLVEKGYLDAEDLKTIQGEQHDVGGRERIAGFQILELLGRGAMGSVYKAKQLSLDRTVALKVLDPELARDEAYVERFMREARAVARLSHTNLISGIDVGDDQGVKYLAMEYADGVTLARILHRGGALDEERALGVAAQLARALDYAHKHGMVHGSVRPENVIITADGVTKLCDLGVVRREASGDDDEEGIELEGTPYYLSPEQARGRDEITAAADLYALGCTLFHMLTGQPPFPAESREAVLARHLTEPAPPVRSLAADVSEATGALVARCLEKDTAARPASAAEVLGALEATGKRLRQAREQAIAGGATPSGPAAAPVVRRRHRRR